MRKELRVAGDRVLVKEDEGAKELKSGIIVPDSVNINDTTGLQKHVRTGTVVHAGQDCKFSQPGMSVIYGRGGAATIEHEGEKPVIVRDSEILFSFVGDEIDKMNDDRVLIEPDPMDRMTEGGIYIPENAAYKPTKGKILKVGTGCKEEKVEEGAVIIFGNRAGSLVEFKGKNYLIIREADVVGYV